MIKIQDFFNINNGKFVDFDGNRNFWCVDLMRQYIKEVMGLDGWILPPTTYAKDIYNKYPISDEFSDYIYKTYYKGWGLVEAKGDWNSVGKDKYLPFTKIPNTPTNYPALGDIVFWGFYPFVTGWAGHVAICSSATVMNLITFDQNYPTGSPCKFIKHSYRGVMGWLHPKR